MVASVHLAAASPNNFFVECTISESQLTNDIVYPRLEHKNGMLRVPEGPGLRRGAEYGPCQ